MAKIIITGSTGFIGQHLTNHLAAKYPDSKILAICNHLPKQEEVTHKNIDLIYCNICDSRTIGYLQSFEPDIIYHLAGISKPSYDNNADVWEVNTLSTMNMVEVGCKCFVLASTVNILANNGKLNPTTIYAASKIASEALLQTAVNQHKIECGYSYRLCGVVGPDMTHGLLPDIIKKLRSDSPALELLQNSFKTYIHIDDVLDKMDFVSHINVQPKEFYRADNYTCFGVISVEEVAKRAMEILNISKPIVFSNNSYIGDILISQPEPLYNNKYYHQSIAAIDAAIRSYV